MTDSGPLERLYRVQQLDLELDRLQGEEARIPDPLRDARAEQERINNALEDAEIELERVERNVRQAELDLGTTREQVERNRAEQEKNAFNSKVQSQYENLIQQLSERVSDYEETLVPLYERRETLSNTAGGLRAEHRALRPQLGSLENEDEARVGTIRVEAGKIRAERDAIAQDIDRRLVKEYDMIRKAKKGLGIVPFTGGRCQGCNVNLPVNVQQRAAQGKLPAVKCPSCGRFLIKLNA